MFSLLHLYEVQDQCEKFENFWQTILPSYQRFRNMFENYGVSTWDILKGCNEEQLVEASGCTPLQAKIIFNHIQYTATLPQTKVTH